MNKNTLEPLLTQLPICALDKISSTRPVTRLKRHPNPRDEHKHCESQRFIHLQPCLGNKCRLAKVPGQLHFPLCLTSIPYMALTYHPIIIYNMHPIVSLSFMRRVSWGDQTQSTPSFSVSTPAALSHTKRSGPCVGAEVTGLARASWKMKRGKVRMKRKFGVRQICFQREEQRGAAVGLNDPPVAKAECYAKDH